MPVIKSKRPTYDVEAFKYFNCSCEDIIDYTETMQHVYEDWYVYVTCRFYNGEVFLDYTITLDFTAYFDDFDKTRFTVWMNERHFDTCLEKFIQNKKQYAEEMIENIKETCGRKTTKGD